MLKTTGAIRGLLVGALTLSPATVWASGLEVSDLGTVALGRGNAFVARADDPTAFHYNPAGLAKLKGVSTLLSVNVLRLDAEFTRQGSGQIVNVDGREVRDPAFDSSTPESIRAMKPFETVSPSTAGSFTPLPMVVVNWAGAFGIEKLALSAGILPPSTAAGREYPKYGPQRYAVGEASGFLIYYGLGAAYEISKDLRIGATLLNASANAKLAIPVRAAAMPKNDREQNEDLFEDHTFEMKVSDWFAPTANLGIEGQPFSFLDLGLSVRLPVTINGKGTLGYRPSENLAFSESYVACAETRDGSCKGDAKLALEQHMPWVVRAGARYIGERFDLELDLIYERWSQADATKITPDATFVIIREGVAPEAIALPTATIDRGLEDTVSVRLGGDYELLPGRLSLRAGSFYSPSAYPDDYATFSLDVPFATQAGVTLGASVAINPTWHLAIAYAHIFQPDIRVTRGKVQQLTATDPNRGNIVNNGLYEIELDAVGLSIEGRFL